MKEILILAGGKGERLKSLFPHIPKPLVPVKDRSFLSYIFDVLQNQKIEKVILCIGYEKKEFFLDFVKKEKRKFKIFLSVEKEPLGTGGAIKNAIKYVNYPHFGVMNGDTFINIDFKKFYEFHNKKGKLISILLTENGERYGSIRTDKNNIIREFREKEKVEKGNLINAGVYIMNLHIFNLYKFPSQFSIEKLLIPIFVKRGEVAGFYVKKAKFFDIGTPDSYKKFEQFVKKEKDDY